MSVLILIVLLVLAAVSLMLFPFAVYDFLLALQLFGWPPPWGYFVIVLGTLVFPVAALLKALSM